MGLYDAVGKISKGISSAGGAVTDAYRRNVPGAEKAMDRGIPKLGAGGQWYNVGMGNTQWDMRDPRDLAMLTLMGTPVGWAASPLIAGYAGYDAADTARFNRKTRRSGMRQATANENMATSMAVSRGMGGGGAGYAMATGAYNDVLRQIELLQKEYEENKRRSEMEMLSSGLKSLFMLSGGGLR